MSDYKHGSMDITEQEKTFAGFMKASTWMVVVVIAVLVFLAIFAS